MNLQPLASFLSHPRYLKEWGTAQVWSIRDNSREIGFVYGRFNRDGNPVFRIRRGGIEWPNEFATFKEAEAKVREV